MAVLETDAKVFDLALRRHPMGYPGVVTPSLAFAFLSHPCATVPAWTLSAHPSPSLIASRPCWRIPCYCSLPSHREMLAYTLALRTSLRRLQDADASLQPFRQRFSAVMRRILSPCRARSIGQAIPRGYRCDMLSGRTALISCDCGDSIAAIDALIDRSLNTQSLAAQACPRNTGRLAVISEA